MVILGFTVILWTRLCSAKRRRLGFESFFMPEHTIFPVDCSSLYVDTVDGSRPDYLSHQADPLVTLARVSATTQKIKLGTAVLLVPEREPMLLAKQIDTLDHLSGGKVHLRHRRRVEWARVLQVDCGMRRAECGDAGCEVLR